MSTDAKYVEFHKQLKLLETHKKEPAKSKLRPRDLGLRLGLFAGEAGLDNPAFRQHLEATWGFAARNANFGLSEVMSILGSQCEATNDLHFHAGDAVFVELLDPATEARLPIAEGNAGELVCTAPFPSMPIAFWNDRDGSKQAERPPAERQREDLHCLRFPWLDVS